MPRQKNIPPDRRTHIKQVALKLFSEKGYHATSTDMIIARAEVSKGLLFFHFRNKKALLQELIMDWAETAWLEVPVPDPNRSAIDELKHLLNHLQQYLKRHESSFRLHTSLMLIEPALYSVSKARKTRAYRQLMAYVSQLIRRFGFKGADLRREVMFLSAVIYGMEMTYVTLQQQRRKYFQSVSQQVIHHYRQFM
jgi:AcrR family transcriptional regulator